MSTAIYKLEVPYVEKDAANDLGATWDEHARTWLCTEHTVERLRRWLPYQPLAPEMGELLAEVMPLPEHKEYVQKLSQSTAFAEWMLLMFGADKWGAFWATDIDGPNARLVFEGQHEEACRFVGKTPSQALEYMDSHRLSKKPERPPEYMTYAQRKEMGEASKANLEACDAELHIGGKILKIKLPWICEQLAQSFDVENIELDANSEISQQIYELLDAYAPDSAKYPLDDQEMLARETSACLRLPLPVEAMTNREKCVEFIHEHERDLTLYRQILKHWSSPNKAIAKRVRDYSKWSLARDWLKAGKPWQKLGEQLNIKREATLQKYAQQADEAEAENGELFSTKLYIDLIACERRGDSAFDVLTQMAEAHAWDEFRMEREARALRQKNRATGKESQAEANAEKLFHVGSLKTLNSHIFR